MGKKRRAPEPAAEAPAFNKHQPPESAANVAAASARGLTYDAKARVYRDEAGEAVRDRLGDPLA